MNTLKLTKSIRIKCFVVLGFRWAQISYEIHRVKCIHDNFHWNGNWRLTPALLFSLVSRSRLLWLCWSIGVGAAGPSPRFSSRGGTKNQKGGHILKILYWMYAAARGPNVKWGDTDFKWGGRAPLPPPLATALRSRQFLFRCKGYFACNAFSDKLSTWKFSAAVCCSSTLTN